MDGLYDIFRGGEKIGKAEVRREGLYYRFLCACDLTGGVIYRLTVTCGGNTQNLGIPVPEGDCFYLKTRLPVSRFSKEEPVFWAVPHHQQKETDMWEPISPETPFDYITRLENAVMERRNGEVGILIKEETEDPVPQDSDQIPLQTNE